MPDPIDTAPPDASATPPAPGFDLSSVYQRLLDKGAAEMSAAQQASASQRAAADKLYRMSAMFNPTVAGIRHKQMIEESQRPILDVLQQHQARETALKEAVSQGQIAAQGFQVNELTKRSDASSDVSKAAQALAVKNGLVPPELAPRLSALTLESVLPSMKGFSDAYATTAGAQEKEATAAATRSATGLKEQAAPGERAKTAAETAATVASAGKTGAETHKIELETGKGPAPGWVPTGEIGATDKDRADFGEAWKSNDAVHKTVDEIKTLMDGHDFVADPKKRAQIQPRIATLIASLKGQVGIQRLAGPEMKFLEEMSADPTKITPGNILGWAKNGVRLEAFKQLSDRELETQAAGKFRRTGGSAKKPAAAPKDTVQMKFPDGSTKSVHTSRIQDAVRAGARQVPNG